MSNSPRGSTQKPTNYFDPFSSLPLNPRSVNNNDETSQRHEQRGEYTKNYFDPFSSELLNHKLTDSELDHHGSKSNHDPKGDEKNYFDPFSSRPWISISCIEEGHENKETKIEPAKSYFDPFSSKMGNHKQFNDIESAHGLKNHEPRGEGGKNYFDPFSSKPWNSKSDNDMELHGFNNKVGESQGHD